MKSPSRGALEQRSHMGSSESILNDTKLPVEVWVQEADGSYCKGCMDTTLQPGATVDMKLASVNQLCVKYQVNGGAKPIKQTVCNQVIPPDGGHIKYRVGDVIENQILIPYTHDSMPYAEVLGIIIAAVMILIALTALILKKFCSFKKNKGLEEKLLEEGKSKSKSKHADNYVPMPGVIQPLPGSKSKQYDKVKAVVGSLPESAGIPKRPRSPTKESRARNPQEPKEVEAKEDKYQDLLCFRCLTNVPGQMLICHNRGQQWQQMQEPYGRDGFTALCPTHYDKVGSAPAYLRVAKAPPPSVKKITSVIGVKVPDSNTLLGA